jgi:hypothetical protein
VPAAIVGTDSLRSLGPIRVSFGAPVDVDDLRGRPLREAAQEATDRLMAAIGELEKHLR